MSRVTIEPYEHDCTDCVWVGWTTFGDRLGNMYFCPGRQGCDMMEDPHDRGSIIIRFSSRPSDYWSKGIWDHPDTKPRSIGMEERRSPSRDWIWEEVIP